MEHFAAINMFVKLVCVTAQAGVINNAHDSESWQSGSLQAGPCADGTLSLKLRRKRQLKLVLAVMAADSVIADQSHYHCAAMRILRVKAPIPKFSTLVYRLFAWGGSGPSRVGLLALPQAKPMGACLQSALLAEEPHGGPAQGPQGLPLAYLPYSHCQHHIVRQVSILHSTACCGQLLCKQSLDSWGPL